MKANHYINTLELDTVETYIINIDIINKTKNIPYKQVHYKIL